MKNTAKSIIAVSLILFALTMGANVLAQEDTTATDVNEQISAQDLGVSNPALLPDNPFYFLKEWGRGIQSFFAFGSLKKAELYQKFAAERLIELKKLVDEGKIDSNILEKATEKYEKTIDKIKELTDGIQETADTNEDVNKFLEKFTDQQILHEKILEKLEKQVPVDVLEKIKQARERHLERFREVMQKLENNGDKIAERLQNALQNGDTNNPGILDKIKEKLPSEVKQKVGAIRTEVMNKVIEKLKKINPSGANCPTLALPGPGFCTQGEIKIERNNDGCIISIGCSNEGGACTQEYDPVCGKNMKTYSNECMANLADVAVQYKGACKLVTSCETDDDCSEVCASCGLPDGTAEYAACAKACVKMQCIDGQCKPPSNSSTCKNLWWFDKNNKVCQQKEFCGSYMYESLKTFNTEAECKNALNITPGY